MRRGRSRGSCRRALSGKPPPPADQPGGRQRQEQRVEAARVDQAAAPEERHGDRGSNAWAVSGRLSVSGQPLLAGDPHLPLVAPATWHQVHLEASAADINVIGVSFAGVPYVILGNNERVAWTATSTQLHPVAYCKLLQYL